MADQPPDYLQGNIEAWQKRAAKYIEGVEYAWASEEPHWGIWWIPESDVGLLPEDMSGLACIELGCGAAYVSAWMCRRGAKVVAIDPTPNQLEIAKRLQREHQLDFVIEEGIAESVPYPDESFDFAISEGGASLWADPYKWIPEAARLLKPGGQLVFQTISPLAVVCMPEYEKDGLVRPELLRPYFGMHRVVWPDAPGETMFHLTHGDWIALLRANGFAIERLIEMRAPPGSTAEEDWADPDWGAQWPAEDVWVVRKLAGS